jgi:hypothetical protein
MMLSRDEIKRADCYAEPAGNGLGSCRRLAAAWYSSPQMHGYLRVSNETIGSRVAAQGARKKMLQAHLPEPFDATEPLCCGYFFAAAVVLVPTLRTAWSTIT